MIGSIAGNGASPGDPEADDTVAPSGPALTRGDHRLHNRRNVEDDMDAATPVDAQNAPTGVWKSRTEREIPTAPTSIIWCTEKEKERRTNHSDQLSTESDQPYLDEVTR